MRIAIAGAGHAGLSFAALLSPRNEVVRNLQAFKDESDLIVANRWADVLVDVSYKVYTRGLFGRD